MVARPAFDPMPLVPPGPLGPPTRGRAVVPADNAPLAITARRLWIGGGGDLTVILRDDVTPVQLRAVPVGMLELWVIQVWATGTTATNIVALA